VPGVGTVGVGGGGEGGAETLGGGATGAEPGRGAKSSSKTYPVQREVKQFCMTATLTKAANEHAKNYVN